jgi:RimJ/RimL family protein N-acetyltransferase
MGQEDIPLLADLGADPDVVKNLISDWSTAERRLEIARYWIEGTQEYGIWGVFDREDAFGVPDRFVGFCAADRPLPLGGLGPEIFYAFRKESWGKGVATEVVTAMIAHLFDDQGVKAVEALVLAGLNPASGRLLEILGMRLVGRYPLAAYVGDECGSTIRYELWRVETAAPQSARQNLEEAAFKIGQFVVDGVASKGEMTVALEKASIANNLVPRLGADVVGKIIHDSLDAGMAEKGWLHYRLASDKLV